MAEIVLRELFTHIMKRKKMLKLLAMEQIVVELAKIQLKDLIVVV